MHDIVAITDKRWCVKRSIWGDIRHSSAQLHSNHIQKYNFQPAVILVVVAAAVVVAVAVVVVVVVITTHNTNNCDQEVKVKGRGEGRAGRQG